MRRAASPARPAVSSRASSPAAGIPYHGLRGRRRSTATIRSRCRRPSRRSSAPRSWRASGSPRCIQTVVVGFGGYVCIPVARAAEQRGIPVVVHEQNSVMGMANKYLARQARAVCLTYEHAAAGAFRWTQGGAPTRQPRARKRVRRQRAPRAVPRSASPRMRVCCSSPGEALGARHLNAGHRRSCKDMLLALSRICISCTSRALRNSTASPSSFP